MIAPELKKQEHLRRVTETITVDDHYEIAESTLGYVMATISSLPNSTGRVWFISLCERYKFDVTHISDSYFEAV